ncbi:hypothetical protein PG995_004637 [Apiospora arundinis]
MKIAASIAEITITVGELLLILVNAGQHSTDLESQLVNLLLILFMVMLMLSLFPLLAFDDLGALYLSRIDKTLSRR